MTGPEHYREAEKLIEGMLREAARSTSDAALPGLAMALQAAQVHATLALVASRVTEQPVITTNSEQARAWTEAVGS